MQFLVEDFENYRPERRTSAMYTLQRRAVKEKLGKIASRVQELLGDQLNGLVAGLSDEAPGLSNKRCVDSQWLTFQRDAEAQTHLRSLLDEIKLTAPGALDVAPHHKHAHLAVVVDDRGLETSLRLHRQARVDRENLAARLKERWAREAFVEHMQQCGEGFSFAAVNGRDLPEIAVGQINADNVQEQVNVDSEWIALTATCSVDDAAALGEMVADACAERLTALLPLYRFVAWSKDNDHIAAHKAIKEAKAEKQRGGFKKGDQVRILAGLWSGRNGLIEEVDKKGSLKVLVGLVSVRVDASDVVNV